MRAAAALGRQPLARSLAETQNPKVRCRPVLTGRICASSSKVVTNADERPMLAMALITRPACRDGPTRDLCESLDKRWGPLGAWLTEADKSWLPTTG